MNSNTHFIAMIGLAIGALFGMSGLVFTSPLVQTALFVFSGVGLSLGLLLLSRMFLKQGEEFTGMGFLVFGIGEAVLTMNSAAEEASFDSAFAGCMLFYVLGHILIFIPRQFPTWMRITGLLSATFFLSAAVRYYAGFGIDTADPLPGIGYGFLVITIIGWITYLARERREVTKIQASNA